MLEYINFNKQNMVRPCGPMARRLTTIPLDSRHQEIPGSTPGMVSSSFFGYVCLIFAHIHWKRGGEIGMGGHDIV